MEGGGQYPGYQSGFEQQGGAMYHQGNYRRTMSPPGMEQRVSPPTQYVAGSFPPPQMYQRPQYAGSQDPSKGFGASKVAKKISTLMSSIPWRYLSFCLLFLSAYFFMQWKLCATGISSPHSRKTSGSSAVDASEAATGGYVNFADLKSSVSGMTGKTASPADETPADNSDSLKDAAEAHPVDPSSNPIRDELRAMAIEPQSWDANEILKLPAADRIIVSEKAKVLYCPIPKAANSNWKYMIRKYEGFPDYEDLALAHDKAKSGLKYLKDFSAEDLQRILNDPQLLKFTFVRDPFARTLSCYLNKFDSKDKSGSEYQVYMAQLYGWPWVNQHDIVNTERPTFEEFVRQISTQAFGDMNEHWAPQTWLCGIGQFPYDFVGKLENLETHAPKIIEWISSGKESHFPTQKEIRFDSVGTSEKVNAFYTSNEVKDKVRGTFQADFDLLQYTK